MSRAPRENRRKGSIWERAEEAQREVDSWPEWYRRRMDASMRIPDASMHDDWGRYSWWPP